MTPSLPCQMRYEDGSLRQLMQGNNEASLGRISGMELQTARSRQQTKH